MNASWTDVQRLKLVLVADVLTISLAAGEVLGEASGCHPDIAGRVGLTSNR